jgi:signal peptidase II
MTGLPEEEKNGPLPDAAGHSGFAENSTPVLELPAPRPATMEYALPIVLIVVVLILDQWLKYHVKTSMFLGEERTLIGNWAKLHFVENNGIAFGGHLPGTMGKFILTSFRILAAAGIFWYLMKLIKRNISRGLVYSGALVFAGATGNIIDSIFYGVWFKNLNTYDGGYFFGQVVDMLYFPLMRGHFPAWFPVIGSHPFEFFRPVFNLADSSITCGILLIIIFFRKSLKDL